MSLLTLLLCLRACTEAISWSASQEAGYSPDSEYKAFPKSYCYDLGTAVPWNGLAVLLLTQYVALSYLFLKGKNE